MFHVPNEKKKQTHKRVAAVPLDNHAAAVVTYGFVTRSWAADFVTVPLTFSFERPGIDQKGSKLLIKGRSYRLSATIKPPMKVQGSSLYSLSIISFTFSLIMFKGGRALWWVWRSLSYNKFTVITSERQTSALVGFGNILILMHLGVTSPLHPAAFAYILDYH